MCPSGVPTNIAEQITFYGPPSKPLSPDYPFMDAAEVGELVADAVGGGRFLVLTAPAVRDEMVERVRDVDAYIAKRVASQAE